MWTYWLLDLSRGNSMSKFSHCFQNHDRNSGHRFLNNCLLEIMGKLLYPYLHPHLYLHPLLGVDKVSAESWQLVNTIHDEGDGLIICEWHSQGYDCTSSCCVCLDFVRADIMATFKVFITSCYCQSWGTETQYVG